jgi:hypothetical protein
MTANHGAIGAHFALPTTEAEFALGDTTFGADGTEWMYVQAGAAIDQYSWVAVDENFQAVEGTTALAEVQHRICFAQVAFADDDFGWVASKGSNINVLIPDSISADGVLFTSSTAGMLTDATSGARLLGVTIVTGLSTAGNTEIMATFPHWVSTGTTD